MSYITMNKSHHLSELLLLTISNNSASYIGRAEHIAPNVGIACIYLFCASTSLSRNIPQKMKPFLHNLRENLRKVLPYLIESQVSLRKNIFTLVLLQSEVQGICTGSLTVSHFGL